MKMKYTEVKAYRQSQLLRQQNLCALCDEPIVDDAVLDHDHSNGTIRCVLHRGCNALLGKIENNLARNRVDLGRLAKISRNLITYITADPTTELLHPTYKTKEERTMAYKKKRKKMPGKKY